MTFVTTQPNVQVQWPSLLQKFKVQSSKFKVMKKDTWKFIIQTVAAILTAIATSLGVTSWQHTYHLSGSSPELQPQLWSSLQLEIVNGLKFVNYICFHARFSV